MLIKVSGTEVSKCIENIVKYRNKSKKIADKTTSMKNQFLVLRLKTEDDYTSLAKHQQFILELTFV